MNKVYITGNSIISALGNNKQEAIENIKTINDNNYSEYLKNNYEDIKYFRIKKNFNSHKEKFYSILEEVVLKAIEDAKLTKEEAQDLHIFLGSTSMSISIVEEQHLKHKKDSTEYAIKNIGYGEIGNFIETLINSKYNSTIVQTACTSSVNSICYANDLIKQNKIKKALVVGFEFFNYTTFRGFQSLMLLSPSGEYKPFDINSDGLILGEACSAVILEPLKKRENDFEILSSNNSFDSYSVTSSNPNGEITLSCMEQALEKANLQISNLTCLKAHATGSENSNLSEVTAIDKLFKKYNQKTDVVILKPYIGHTLGACGTNEIVLLCETIKNNFLPKTINFNEKYKDVSFTPLLENKKINHATILFHFIGFGGSNTSIILSNEK
ncbi:beta-ketoacyl synthase N-terminal-like domain-containing protein [Arcobacter aquimarinus]|uniref:Beta-ketoacyl-[acp] synthase n=1 Tax=Arcobacter aquimarinus TaxID=1315211 RepID=A0AAE7B074_9BACT|nr:beta-ketoacyl synthase N-terminal-like domain-containing protein [Arcobacter aquimarinus]QKE24973.1 beta-ketoacyl-[acp] synthase [Arcobacter aquimarinus]RXI36785.1 beta-ketoacyl synthase [Arcobacter aquimarinus]